jgi:hypothetical protein
MPAIFLFPNPTAVIVSFIIAASRMWTEGLFSKGRSIFNQAGVHIANIHYGYAGIELINSYRYDIQELCFQ